MTQLIPNTFGVSAKAYHLVTVHSIDELCAAYQFACDLKRPFLVIGEGSNTLFTEDFSGVVAINHIKGITLDEHDPEAVYLTVGSGERWHDLVCYTLEHHLPGLENLALIPGSVGSAAIQNIGAYGVEFQQFAVSVDLIELATGQRLTVIDGQYGYRDSIFKSRYNEGFVVVSVTLRLPRQWQPNLSYGELKVLTSHPSLSAETVFDAVCAARRAKLPDPQVLGNAGSFFKNPVISAEQAQTLLDRYPNMPIYPQADQRVKVAAGWLIDQCGLKGMKIGQAAVHDRQALVIVNLGEADAASIVALAEHIQAQVKMTFGISLEREVRYFGANGELKEVSID